MFVESRCGLEVRISGGGDLVSPGVEKRWESGAHLRRFAEGRHESFVLDSPTAEGLESLALQPGTASLEWMSGPRLFGSIPPGDEGPWSAGFLDGARQTLTGWLESLRSRLSGTGVILSAGAELIVSSQEILVIATDRDPARDTRSFMDATITIRVERAGTIRRLEETRAAASLEDLAGLIRRTADSLSGRALSALEAVAAPSGEMPVIFESPSGGYLLHEICGHLLEADHVLGGASPFLGARGEAIASPILDMADDGSIPGLRGSTLFDDEGVAARRTPLVIKGTLVGYLSDRLTAFATDGISTGNGRRQSYRDAPMPRMTNLVIDPGQETFESILRMTPGGLLVKRLGRGIVDPASGRFALSVEEGFTIEEGAVGRPVSGAVLRGVAADTLHRIDAVGCDPLADTSGPLCLKDGQAIPFGILQPTLRVSSMTVSGPEP